MRSLVLMIQPSLSDEYLHLGRKLAGLLGSSLNGASAEALKDLARAYDPSAHESRIAAEIFLLHKYLLVQACIGVFPDAHAEGVVGGLFAALNEKASGLEFSQERQDAMEQMWIMRAKQFDQPFTQDRQQSLREGRQTVQWKRTVTRFCLNVRELDNPPDIWTGGDSPSHEASRSVAHTLDSLLDTLREMRRLHFGD